MAHSNNDIQESLARAVAAQTPDVLSDILRRVGAGETGDTQPTTLDFPLGAAGPKKRRRTLRWVVSVAAVLVLLVGLYSGFSYVNGLEAIVSFDVNPSIELRVTRAEKVLSATALNSEANDILDGMNLQNVDLDVAVNALIGSMLKHGYISTSKNTILISVENSNAQKGAALQERLASEVGSILNSNAVEGAVLSQTLADDARLRALAKQHDISLGKAALVDLLVSQNPQLDFAAMAALPINDISLLLASKQTALEGVASSGQASSTAYIGEEQAKTVALTYASVSPASVLYIQAELDYEDGRMIYEVEFATTAAKYDYEIDAQSGAVLKQEAEQVSQPTPPATSGSSGPITEAQAKAIALQHAGLQEADVRFVKVVQYDKRGVSLYDLIFLDSHFKYSYEVDAGTGEILNRYIHQIDDVNASQPAETPASVPTPAQSDSTPMPASTASASSQPAASTPAPPAESQPPAPPATSTITAEQAQAIAAGHAGVPAAEMHALETELDEEDGVLVYELEFKHGSTEYDYTINATTGAILDWDRDEDDEDD